MSYVSRFVDEDAHFEEVPGCPLHHARAGGATERSDESACATCRFNVAFPREPTIGCVVRTPHRVVEAALARAPDAIARDLKMLRAQGAASDLDAKRRWAVLGEGWLAAAAADDNDGREVASIVLRFANVPDPDPVEILR